MRDEIYLLFYPENARAGARMRDMVFNSRIFLRAYKARLRGLYAIIFYPAMRGISLLCILTALFSLIWHERHCIDNHTNRHAKSRYNGNKSLKNISLYHRGKSCGERRREPPGAAPLRARTARAHPRLYIKIFCHPSAFVAFGFCKFPQLLKSFAAFDIIQLLRAFGKKRKNI